MGHSTFDFSDDHIEPIKEVLGKYEKVTLVNNVLENLASTDKH